MLLRLCTAMGIETEPSRFANPLAERERLEGLLRRAGVDFRTLDDHRGVKVAEHGSGGGRPAQGRGI